MKTATEKLQKLLDLILLIHPDFMKEQEKNRLYVFNIYSRIFSKQHLVNLTEEEMRGFLRYSNNKHWSGLQRQAPNICKDMQILRKALIVLVDEKNSIIDRLNQAKQVHGLDKAIISAILQVTYPEKYGVWNKTSEDALKSLKILPEIKKEKFGEKYNNINKILLALSKDLRIDLWTLDTLFWYWSKIIVKL